MRESEKPVSFIVRPWMRRGTPAEDDERATKETFRVEPLGILPPRAKTPLTREYYLEQRDSQPFITYQSQSCARKLVVMWET